MRMHAQPFAEDGRRKLHGQNLAAALLEGAFQRIGSALKKRGGEIPAVGPVPCTDPQAPCLLKPWFDFFFISLGWTRVQILAGQNGTETCGRGQTLLRCRFCFIEARPLIFDGHFLEAESFRLVFVRFFISGQEHIE